MSAAGFLSQEESAAALYRLALAIAEEHGAHVPDTAMTVGPYAFMAELRRLGWSQNLPARRRPSVRPPV
ncbi:hypothetical protein ACFW17_28040 [Streptomyces sp. NPDC058961]|uniref:hypothetical protein n=1 Tax=Streptomyces sp. NPDC058961 TaxID=3346680 RepID=UPI0036C29F23